MSKQTDPRAEFNDRAEHDLRSEQGQLMRKRGDLQRSLESARPTRAEVEAWIADAQRIAGSYAGRAVYDGLWAIRQGGLTPDSASRDVIRMASAAFLASDAFRDLAIEHYAAQRPAEDVTAPLHEELERANRRKDAVDAELRLRELDRRRATEEAERLATMKALEAAG